MGRVLAQKLSEALGQQVVVENRAGAGTAIGNNEVVASTPEAFGSYLRSETEKWARVGKAAGIQPQ